MPEYEYRCVTCGKEFSVRMTISEHDTAQVSCPHCQSAETRQILSVFVTHTSNKS